MSRRSPRPAAATPVPPRARPHPERHLTALWPTSTKDGSGGGGPVLGHEPGRGAAGDRRAAGPSVVRGGAVPSGAEEQAVRSASFVRLLHRDGGQAKSPRLRASKPSHLNSHALVTSITETVIKGDHDWSELLCVGSHCPPRAIQCDDC